MLALNRETSPRSDLVQQIVEQINTDNAIEVKMNQILGEMIYVGFTSGLTGNGLRQHVDSLRQEAGVSEMAVNQIMCGFKIDPNIGMDHIKIPVRLPINRFATVSDPEYTERNLATLLEAYAKRIEYNLGLIDNRPALTSEGITEVLETYIHRATEHTMSLKPMNAIILEFIEKLKLEKDEIPTSAILRTLLQDLSLNSDFLTQRATLFLPDFRRAKERRINKLRTGIEPHKEVKPEDSKEFYIVENESMRVILNGILASAVAAEDFNTQILVERLINNINGSDEPVAIVIEGQIK